MAASRPKRRLASKSGRARGPLSPLPKLATEKSDKKRRAIHEAGHVLACYQAFDPHENPLSTVTIHAAKGLQAHVQWADAFNRGQDQEAIENEIVTLLGGVVAEELVLGDFEGGKADLAAIQKLVKHAPCLEHKNPQGEEAKAYLGWLRIRTKNKFRKQPWRDALNALADELLEKETTQYRDLKNVIERIVSAQNRALNKLKKDFHG
jgi:ATP-dependent Zn protease